MPDIYDELAAATGWKLTHNEPMPVWQRDGEKVVGHPYAIDAAIKGVG